MGWYNFKGNQTIYSDKDRLTAIESLALKAYNDSGVIFQDTRLRSYAEEIMFLATASQTFLEENKDKFPTLEKETDK